MNKPMKRILIVIISTFVLCGSCKETIPAFSQQMRRYLPYQDGNIVLYASSVNDTIQFVANNVDFTDEHKHSFGCKCGGVTELKGNMQSETLSIEYLMICDESKIEINAMIKHDEIVVKTYSKKYSYNSYAEDVIDLIGDTITLQSDNGDNMILRKDEGIICLSIDDLKCQIIL